MFRNSNRFEAFTIILIFFGFLSSIFLFPQSVSSEMISTSVQVKIVSATTTTTSAAGAAGGGGGYIPPATEVIFTGKAYPNSTVTLLKDAQIVAATVAGSAANFQMSLSGISPGTYIFSLYSEDNKENRSSLLTFPITITSGVTINVTGIFISPTIDVDKTEVKRGEDIAIFGQSVPEADIIISVNSEEELFGNTVSDKDGIYLYHFDTSVLDYGFHYTKSKALIEHELASDFSYLVNFKVGTKTVQKIPTTTFLKGDLNNDKKVNLIDFSIAAYWYKRSISKAFTIIEAERLNSDGKINLVDFSIMAYYWTG